MSRKETRDDTLKNIAVGLAAVTVSIGLSYLAYKKAPGSISRSASATHAEGLEKTIEKGGPDLDKAIKLRIDNLRAGKNMERNSRDLKILMDNEYISPDDTHGFLRRLNKNKYTPDEIDALWDYAGMYRDPDKPDGGITKGAFRWQRRFRGSTPLNRAELKTANNLDRAIRKNSLPHRVKLFRGIAATEAEAQKWATVKPGYVIRDKAPIFTGLTESRANPHYAADVLPSSKKFKVGRTHPVLFVIDAPKGLPAVSSPYGHGLASQKIPIPSTVDIKGKKIPIPGTKKLSLKLPFLKHLNKEEIVLKRNQPLRVVSSQMREDGVLEVHVIADIDG